MLENIYFWTWSFLLWSNPSRRGCHTSERATLCSLDRLPFTPPLLSSLFGNPDSNKAWPKSNEISCGLSCPRDFGKVLSWSQTTVTDSSRRKYTVTGSGVWRFLLHGKALGQPLENTALLSCVFTARKSK